MYIWGSKNLLDAFASGKRSEISSNAIDLLDRSFEQLDVVQPLQVLAVRRQPDQRTNLVSASAQPFDDMAAQKAACSRYENSHAVPRINGFSYTRYRL